jgi:hypothetical protein
MVKSVDVPTPNVAKIALILLRESYKDGVSSSHVIDGSIGRSHKEP